MKFGRNYQLSVDMNDGTGEIIIDPPFSIQFNVERSVNTSMNTMLLVIYNLGEVTRNSIFQDFFYTSNDRFVRLQAGYGDELSTIFSGNIRNCFSARRGPDVLTTIHAFDGGFATETTLTSKTLADGISRKEVVEILIGDLKLQQGAIGNLEGNFKRGPVLDGNTFNLLKTYTENQVFVDLGRVFVLQNDEVIEGIVQEISSASGLLETPRREDSFLSVDMLFEPQIAMGQIIQLDSSIQPLYNGQYKVVGIKHQGVISEAVGGQCITTLNLLLGDQYFNRFKRVQS